MPKFDTSNDRSNRIKILLKKQVDQVRMTQQNK